MKYNANKYFAKIINIHAELGDSPKIELEKRSGRMPTNVLYPVNDPFQTNLYTIIKPDRLEVFLEKEDGKSFWIDITKCVKNSKYGTTRFSIENLKIICKKIFCISLK